MRGILIVAIILISGCAKKEVAQSYNPEQQTCSASYMSQGDTYGGWYQFIAPGIVCVGKFGDGFSRCSR